MNDRLRLIHPIYLDVPMLVSFAAAVEGGIVVQSEVTRERGSRSSIEAKGETSVGLSKLFGNLFDLSAKVGGGHEKSHDERAWERESKGHTEASIAIMLYDHLCSDPDSIVRPKEVAELEGLEPGSLVEFTGTVEKNAVDTVIDFIDAAQILTSLSSKNQQANNMRSKKKAHKPQVAHEKTKSAYLQRLREGLDKDRRRTPISNILLRCSQPTGCTAVVTLRTENLRDLTLSELHKNSVSVIGKITRIVDSGDSISAFENYGLALLEVGTLKKLFMDISSSDGIRAEFSDVEVEGPAVQLLPLMVFV